MTYAISLFVTRKPTLTSNDFRQYWEGTHVPLLQTLTGHYFPQTFKRQYLARIDREGFGGPANRNRPLLVLAGNPDDYDLDAVAEMVWEDERTFQEFYRIIYQSEVAAKLIASEQEFLDTRKTKVVVVGETLFTTR